MTARRAWLVCVGPRALRLWTLALLVFAAHPPLAAQTDNALLPTWLQQRIARYETAPLGAMPTEVWTFERGGKPVYYLRGDRGEELVTLGGDRLCRIGMQTEPTKATDRACTQADFASTAMRLVWQDPRIGVRVPDGAPTQ